MASPTLLTAGAVSLAAGACFLFVARAVSHREATGDRLLARRAHVIWWLGLGCYLLSQGAFTIAAAFDSLDPRLYVGSRAIIIPLLCAATWGITFYLTYLYTGNPFAARPLAILYGFVALLFAYATYSVPQTVTAERWIVSLDDDTLLYRAVYALVGLPPIVASIAYLALLRTVEEREQRRRIMLSSGSILVYVASGLAARLTADDTVIFLTLVPLGLLAGALSVMAYVPAKKASR